MKNTNRIIGAATLIAAFGLAAVPAMAGGINAKACARATKEVRSVLQQQKQNSHTYNSPQYEAAEQLHQDGRRFCHLGMFKAGIARQEKALALVGPKPDAADMASNR